MKMYVHLQVEPRNVNVSADLYEFDHAASILF